MIKSGRRDVQALARTIQWLSKQTLIILHWQPSRVAAIAISLPYRLEYRASWQEAL
jgi:hypothetical protein